jgi:serine phosphatase RsbU (regulator of sigma subunit)
MTGIVHDRLELLYRLSQAFNSSLDLDQVLERVIDEVIAATRAERGFIMLRAADGQLVFRAARGIDRKTIEEPKFEISRSIVESVAHDATPVVTSDALHDAQYQRRESVMNLRLRSILCVPLLHKGVVLGVIYVDNRLQAGIFTEKDLDLLNAIGASAAIAIENARLYQVAVEKGRLERELQVARSVQTSLLPGATPQIEGWEFAAWWEPARQVAGDFYDFIPAGGGQLGLVIADVSDKGMPAALFMALSRSTVRASVTAAATPTDGINRANRLLCADATDGMFVTLFYAQLDPAAGGLLYVNAGHNPPLHYNANADQLDLLTRTGMPLGVDDLGDYGQRSVQLASGDLILLYTDGVTDARNARGEEFGLKRLRDLVFEHRRAAASNVVAALTAALRDFTAAAEPFDDITVVAVKRL